MNQSALLRPDWTPATVALMVLGFVVFWPLGLAMLAYILFGEKFQAFKRDANRKALHEGGRVVYLHASVEQQVGRTARDRNRPLLRTANPEKTLRDLLAIRDPLYREIADLVVETDERPPRMVVLDILDRLAQLPPR